MERNGMERANNFGTSAKQQNMPIKAANNSPSNNSSKAERTPAKAIAETLEGEMGQEMKNISGGR